MSDVPVLSYSPYSGPRMSWGSVLQQVGALAGLVLAYTYFAALRPKTFFSWDTAELIFRDTAIVATAALGMTIVIISNGIDLSVGSQIALVSVVIALLVRGGQHPAAAALAGILTAAACGVLIGVLVTRLKVLPFIVTLGLLSALRGLAIILATDDRGSQVYPPDRYVNAPMPVIGTLMRPLPDDQHWMLLPSGVWLTVLLAVLVAGVLRYTKFGRHVFAIGSNEQTARLCGINVPLTKILVYTFAGVLTGIAGVMQLSRIRVGDPTSANGRELDVIAAVVIGGGSLSGGRGSVVGTMIGALLMTVVRTGCVKMNYSIGVQMIVTGVIIVLAVTLDRLQNRGDD